jgi:hypothetical protein
MSTGSTKTSTSRVGKLDREIDAYLAQGDRVVVDHSHIPHDNLRIALNNARRNPDGEVFPWLSQYPTIGATVYYDGRLWTVLRKGRHRNDSSMTMPIGLVGQGHEDETTQARGDLRPVSWTQADEDRHQGAR